MACLGAVLYDPATAATVATSTPAKAMTALDTTNARITFNAPANGIVLAKVRAAQKGATTNPCVLLGVLDGSTVRGRQSAMNGRAFGSAPHCVKEVSSLITGLTPSSSYTFDAAYGVETVVAATTLGWGGPNDTTASNAYGALSFEIWETDHLLAGVNYDPATAVSKSTASLLAMTAIDTTNLRLSFTAPASGRVAVRLRTTVHGGTAYPSIYLGVLDGSTIRMRQAPIGGNQNLGTVAATDIFTIESFGVISGLSGSYTWDAAYAVETVATGSGMKYGGPNDTTADNAWGGFGFEVWEA